MDHEALIFAAAGYLIAPVCTLAGFFAGAWVNDRAHNHLPPIPNVARAIGSLVQVVKRTKKEPASRLLMKPRKS